MESGAPQRTCIGCRRKNDQDLLIRISRDSNGEIVLSPEKHRTGRGAYVCLRAECVEAALKGDRLGRALKWPVSPEDKAILKQALGDIAKTIENPNNTAHAN